MNIHFARLAAVAVFAGVAGAYPQLYDEGVRRFFIDPVVFPNQQLTRKLTGYPIK